MTNYFFNEGDTPQPLFHEEVDSHERELHAQVLNQEQLKEIVELQEVELNEKSAELETLRHENAYLQHLRDSPDLFTVSEIALDYGLSSVQMNQLLDEHQIQYRYFGQWMPYSEIRELDLGQTVTFRDRGGQNHYYWKWNSKGREFIYHKLKKVGIVPLSEKQYQK
ncbi:MAG: phage antirepressor KilAC domain-containing protein [Bacteroidales bacterium]|nr:phage antirepressor KilAC domain-containing protein [Bacteroidales bacterium]